MSADVRSERDAATPARDPRRPAALPEADDVNAGTPADAAAHRRASRLIGDARLLLIALWLGGAVFFSFVVAPTAFAVLPTHELAGAVVTRTIAVVNVGGFVVALLLIASGLFVSDEAVSSRRARLVEFVSLAVIAVACGIGHWIVAARMVALRASMGLPIDRVPLDDPARVAFNSLHGYSVALMGAGVLAGLVALLLIGRRNRLVLVGLTTKVESLER